MVTTVWNEPLTEQQKVEILLRRITFGPRPGDSSQVERMGRSQFLEQQLHPGALNDSVIEAKLQGLQTLQMSPAELAEDFPPPMKVKRRQGKRFAELERRGEVQTGGALTGEADSQQTAMYSPGDQARREETAPDPRAPSDLQPQGPRTIVTQLGQAELLRAVYSDRQLQEVMVHFWMNHFNIYWPKGADRYYLTSFEQDVIRPRALGNFEDLLVATAQSPAMLFSSTTG